MLRVIDGQMNPYVLMSIPLQFVLRTNRSRPQEGNQVKFRVDAQHSARFSQINRDPLRQDVSLNAMGGANTHSLPIRVRTL